MYSPPARLAVEPGAFQLSRMIQQVREGVLVAAPGVSNGNRTHITSLEGWRSAVELHPHVIGGRTIAGNYQRANADAGDAPSWSHKGNTPKTLRFTTNLAARCPKEAGFMPAGAARRCRTCIRQLLRTLHSAAYYLPHHGEGGSPLAD